MSQSDDNERVVRDLYAAVARRDAEAVGAIVRGHMADDVVLREPDSLPWGGEHRGVDRVARLFQGIAAAPAGKAPIDAESMVVRRVAAGSEECAVELGFDLTTAAGAVVPHGAIEWFSFAGGHVTEIRAAYHDAAAFHARADG